ncbi:MAG: ComEC/Rec2 family competence protein [bacterium]|nr:ComEC/Rec2 family competence protein [bacterium]
MYHKSQIFFYLLSAFIGGVLLASLLDFSQSLIWVVLVVAVSVVVIAGENKLTLLAVTILAFLVVGATRFNQFNFSEDSLEQFVGQEIILTGYIDNEPETDGTIQRFALKINQERVLITIGSYPKYKFGDFVQVSGELEWPKNFSEDFDYITYLKKDGIKTILFFPQINEYAGDLNLGFWENLRLSLYKKIFAVKDKFQTAVNLSISEPNASFVNGILLGSRQNIPDDLKEAFNKTGTTHILAISGYNIMIISWAILSGLIFFFRRRVAFWISVGVIILFVILTGASASVVRAALMGLILSFAHGYGRLYDQKNSIILAGAAMVWINPFVLVFDIGFQLSFAAVLGLVYLYPKVDEKLYKIPRLGNFKELTLMTISAQLAVAPLLIYYFGNFSLVSLPTNLLILPFVPASMLLGFVAGLGGMIYQPLGQVIGYATWAITTYQIEVVKYLSL